MSNFQVKLCNTIMKIIELAITMFAEKTTNTTTETNNILNAINSTEERK